MKLHEQLQLQPGQVRALRLAQVSILKAGQGRVWVTQEGRPEDFWLEAGQSVVLLPGSLVVVEAQTASAVRVEALVLQSARAWLGLCRAGLCGLGRLLGARAQTRASARSGGEGR